MPGRLQALKHVLGYVAPADEESSGEEDPVMWQERPPPKQVRPRTGLATAHAVFVAGALVVLVLNGLSLPLAFFLLVAIIAGFTLIFANRRFVESRSSSRGEVASGAASTDDKPPAGRVRMGAWSRVLLSVVLAFVAAECATMTIYDKSITDRIAADVDRRFAPTVGPLQQSVVDLARQAEDLYPAVSRADDDDRDVQNFRRQSADLTGKLAALPPWPCPAIGPCSVWRRNRAAARNDLLAQRGAVDDQLRAARAHVQDVRVQSSAQLTDVNADLTAKRMELSRQDQDRAAALENMSTGDRITALVALRGWEQSFFVPLVLFAVAIAVDYGLLRSIASRGTTR